MVAAIFCAMMPDLPTPSSTILPAHLVRIERTRSRSSAERRAAALAIASDSARNSSTTCEYSEFSLMQHLDIRAQKQLQAGMRVPTPVRLFRRFEKSALKLCDH